MKITIQQLKDARKQERNVLCEVSLNAKSQDTSNPGEWCTASTLSLLDERTVEVFVNYAPGNKNFSVMMMLQEGYLFTASCRWHDLPPYFGFRLVDGSFLEICCSVDGDN